MDHSKIDHSKMDHSKMDHGDHGAIPMGMAGHDHHKMMIADFKKRFWLSTILTIPILVLSPMIQIYWATSWRFPVTDLFCLCFPLLFTSGAAGLF